MPFPERFLEELIERNDIVDVVSTYVNLTKRSGSNLFGLCPFHNEKTPSFSVNREKQIYHCFGCGKGGSVFNFIMEEESLTFPEAVEFLAKRVGMTVPEDGFDDGTRNRRARMLALNRDAARFFHDTLKTPKGSAAAQYLERRGISPKMVTRFGLGVAPDGWDTLINAMTAKGYGLGELLDAGLVKSGKHGGYDVFRNRLMFPVIDVRGNVIGFSGRILGDGEPKYLNSPDTLVFQKSRNLFAMNLAKKTKREEIILVEGNVDVVSLHQAGFDSAVASLGTSLTPEQAGLISRYTKRVVISYDGDGAGVKAAHRAIGILEATGLDVRVLQMEGAKDPDELIQKHGRDAFQILLDKSENQVEYRLLSIKKRYDLGTDDGRIGFLAEATALIAELPSAVEREIFGAKVAEQVGISAEAVSLEVQRAYKKRGRQEKRRREDTETRVTQSFQPKARELRYENPVSARAEEGVIRLILDDPELVNTPGLSGELFTSTFLRRLYEEIIRRHENGEKVSVPLLAEQFSAAEISRITEIQEQPLSQQNAGAAMLDYIEKIRTEQLKRSGENAIRELAEQYRQKKGYGG